MNEPQSWTLTLEEADDGSGDLILPLTDEIMESAGWKPGDTLEWIDTKNGAWILRKIEKTDETPADTTE
jgi:bifunctional DNA-binding transcriptional regulator/antitoxin component of YhaV-PrlF toxin-antitoxin module